MAINSPDVDLASVTISELDVALLAKQVNALTQVLRDPQALAPSHRPPLLGIKKLLEHMLKVAHDENPRAGRTITGRKKYQSATPLRINQVRDLLMIGVNGVSAADRTGLSKSTASRIRSHEAPYCNVPYKRTEFIGDVVVSDAAKAEWPWFPDHYKPESESE